MPKSMVDLQNNGKEVTSLGNSDLLLATTDPAGLADDAVISWGSLQRLLNGWIPGSGTWSYSSADSPSFVASVPDADAANMGVGDRIKLTQTTIKYFIVTAKGTPSGGFTSVTFYGGTDYTLVNAAITSPYYSHVKTPIGFPLSPLKWSVTVTDTSSRTQASPTQHQWYNLGGAACQIVVPIGLWELSYEVFVNSYIASAGSNAMHATLSTANNSESDPTFTTQIEISGATATVNVIGVSLTRKNTVNLASKTTYYLNGKTKVLAMNNITFANDQVGMKLLAKCAYL